MIKKGDYVQKKSLSDKLDIANALLNSLFFITSDEKLVNSIIDKFYEENHVSRDSIMTDEQADKFLNYLNKEYGKYE